MKTHNKRGQITLFIILGLVLLIGAALYVYYTNKVQISTTTVPKYTGDAGQVQTFVDNCIEQVGRQGIIELGRHGGYINPLSRAYTLTSLNYDQTDQSESDMAFLNSNDISTGIPYWYYYKSDNSCWHCDVSSLAPTVQLMEAQLGVYVDNNLDQCLDNYNSLKDQGFDISVVQNSTTTASILDSKVDFLTNYTIQIVKDGDTKYIQLFYTEVNIPLLQYYLIATNITQNEINNEYLDVYALYLLGQYNGPESDKLPPLSGYTTGYDSIFWSKTNVRRLYESLLSSYIPFFRIKGAVNDVNVSTKAPIESKMYGGMSLNMFDKNSEIYKKLKYLEISHIYLGQSIYLDVRPSNGDLVSPSVTQDTLPFGKAMLTVDPDQEYNFFYDISYPVVVEIKDTRPNNEYEFMFALQGNVKENKLMSDWLSGLGTIPWNNEYVKLRNDIPNGTVFIDPETGENVSYEPITSTQNFFCDKSQRVSGDIKLKTYDSVTEKSLSDVSITYGCGTYASCYIDATRYNVTVNDSYFVGKLPLCVNGYLELEKDGYLTKRIVLTTEYQQPDYLGSVYLEPITTKNVTVKKYDVSRVGSAGNDYSLGQLMNLSINDSVILTFEKITFDPLEEPWSKTLMFGKDAVNVSEVQLVSGAYTVTAQLLDYNGVTIPKDCQRIKVKGRDDILVPDNDIKIDVAMQGGVTFNESNPFIITTEDLLSNKSLEFYVVRMPNPRCLNDMNEPSLTGYMAKKYRVELTPKFK